MKKVVALVLVVVSIVCLSACGSSKAIVGISEKTTLSKMKSMTKGEIGEEQDRFWLKNGGEIGGLSVGSLLVVGKETGTLECVELDGIYSGSNKDIVDEMLVSMTKHYGNPKTKTEEGTSYSYILYVWDKGTDQEKTIMISEKNKKFSFTFNY